MSIHTSRLGRRHGRKRAFTFIEMLVTVTALVIVLSLMVSLARHVRERSAQALTKSVLRRLDLLMTQYSNTHDGALPTITLFPPPSLMADDRSDPPAELSRGPDTTQSSPPVGVNRTDSPRDERWRTEQRRLLAQTALANSRDFVAVLENMPGAASPAFTDFPVSIYDESHLRDAWGSPIVFMPSKHPWVGTAPRDKVYFFFSAGPDRDYLTRDDNLYSYEEIVGTR